MMITYMDGKLAWITPSFQLFKHMHASLICFRRNIKSSYTFSLTLVNDILTYYYYYYLVKIGVMLLLFRCQRIKTEFTFEYNYLEDELIV